MLRRNLPYIPYNFRAYHNTTQSSGSGAFAKMSFNTENWDISGNFGSSTFTAPVAGYYFFFARANTTGTPTRLLISLYKNGSEHSRGDDLSDDEAQAAGSGVSVSGLIQLAVNDTVEVYSFGNTALTLESGTTTAYFGGYLVTL